jgi:hypothetical protein
VYITERFNIGLHDFSNDFVFSKQLLAEGL